MADQTHGTKGLSLTWLAVLPVILAAVLTGFMGIPYAIPPVGERRFRLAEPVSMSNETVEAYYLGPRCPGKQLVPFLKDPILGPDYEPEDCLTVNIWRKKGHSPSKGKLPVAVLIPGGAFNRGGARMHNSHTMLAFSEEPYIAVSIQYRIGVFGGLNTELTAKEGLLNLGLEDIYVALEWVQENIGAFGGDADDVTIMGLSAAAHGIGHLIMDINQPKKLFHKAIMDSGAHTARAVHPPNAELNTRHFCELLDLAPCSHFKDLVDPEILACLRRLPSETVDNAGKEVFARSDPSMRWAWQPVIDPNAVSGRFSHRPDWESFDGGKGKTMVLGLGNDERAGGTGAGEAATLLDFCWGEEQCEFWWRVSSTWED
ncbi:hypothetical protein F66182_8537 [Fusarium sp. NRRL 66182]|nr:hypothetical protein F66182_8537 [Fusarium sp. NRRL 66182]